MDTVSWEWTALSTKIAMDSKLPLFLADVLIQVLLIITSPIPHTHILTGNNDIIQDKICHMQS